MVGGLQQHSRHMRAMWLCPRPVQTALGKLRVRAHGAAVTASKHDQ